ncbi:MAG: hypothetical protein RLZZ152_1259, partial [Pseudomonadota bacterium]
MTLDIDCRDLPKSGFEIQYKFKNGEVVDAIINVGDKILPIDS